MSQLTPFAFSQFLHHSSSAADSCLGDCSKDHISLNISQGPGKTDGTIHQDYQGGFDKGAVCKGLGRDEEDQRGMVKHAAPAIAGLLIPLLRRKEWRREQLPDWTLGINQQECSHCLPSKEGAKGLNTLTSLSSFRRSPTDALLDRIHLEGRDQESPVTVVLTGQLPGAQSRVKKDVEPI